MTSAGRGAVAVGDRLDRIRSASVPGAWRFSIQSVFGFMRYSPDSLAVARDERLNRRSEMVCVVMTISVSVISNRICFTIVRCCDLALVRCLVFMPGPATEDQSPSCFSSFMLQPFKQDHEYLVWRDGLDDEVIHSGLQASDLVFGEGVGGHRQNRCPLVAR